jgi:hypothetical protein
VVALNSKKQTRPWMELGISRAAYYRRQSSGETRSVRKPSETETRCVRKVPLLTNGRTESHESRASKTTDVEEEKPPLRQDTGEGRQQGDAQGNGRTESHRVRRGNGRTESHAPQMNGHTKCRRLNGKRIFQ